MLGVGYQALEGRRATNREQTLPVPQNDLRALGEGPPHVALLTTCG